MLEFLRTNAGIFWQYSLAAAFQLVGVLLVVRDVRRSRRNDQLLARNLGVIWKVWNDIPEDSGPHSLEVARGDEQWATMIRPSLEIDMRVRNVRLALEQVIGHGHAQKEPNKWLARLGPIALALGIVLAFTASMFAVR
ncbi:hypothetical protein [Rhodococcus sp. (in: high G+C Gram-positive bacteria)]|uniref:hypothetical protein n=1 Tax=Rhodococcus sp. TaxID=1831 RepID=UPI0025845692|nr:hypothetical protein [Rhodococcus sp. (in: high G+C Gram-positive bacteria)]